MQNSKCIKYELQEVTPGMAQKWLSHNCGNRNLSKSVVTKLKNSILMGSWEVTHQGIAVDESGNLIDGQHRCTAIVQADKTVPCWIATYSGSTTAKEKPIDIGSKRSVSCVTGIGNPTCEILLFFSRLIGMHTRYQGNDLVKVMHESCSPQQKELLDILGLKKLPAPIRAAFFVYCSLNPKEQHNALDIFDKVSSKGPNRYFGLSAKESMILNVIDTSDYSAGRYEAYFKTIQILESKNDIRKLHLTDKYREECRDTVRSMFAKAINAIA